MEEGGAWAVVLQVMHVRMWSSVGLMTIQQRRDLTLRLQILGSLRLRQEQGLGEAGGLGAGMQGSGGGEGQEGGGRG